MDYSSIDSELIESLDFLRPPVKRAFRNTNRSTITNLESHINNIKVLKDFRKKFFKDSQIPQSKLRTAESSTSLILKKTTEREIRQQYSVLSYSNILGHNPENPKISSTYSPVSNEKPLIKVTVIPKTAQTQPVNALNKRKHLPKRVHATVSNQENSVQTKNLYLVVKGKKREKVYEIKTTGSAKFTNTRSKNDFKDEIIPIEQLSSLKLVLDSLNMDRDREKDRRRRKKPDIENFVEYSRIINGNENYRECTCWNPVRATERYRECTCLDEVRGEGGSHMANCKSRVRITGHLGFNEDDRYVLRCAATVNDKPVPTDYSAVEQTAPYVRHEERQYNDACTRDSCLTRCYNVATYCPNTRDCNIQADLQNENKSEIPPTPRVMQCKESQATQVNFNIGSPDVQKCRNKFLNKDEIIQCCRTNVHSRASLTDTDSDSNSLKACQSPLVIISVYPMQDCCENVKVVKTYQDDGKSSSPRKPSVHVHNSERPSSGTKPNNEKKTDNKVSRSRSRSPYSQHKTLTKPNVAETKIIRTHAKKTSPGPEVTPSTNKPNRPIKNNQEKTYNKPNSTKNRQGNSPQVNSPKESIGVNTEHNVTKKNLVESYTKKLTDYLNSENGEANFRFPRSDPSKVTVNIDGDNEYYNVLFEQANSTTDLKVRKTVKGNPNKTNAENVRGTSPPIKNLQKEESKRKSSPAQCKNQQKDDQKIQSTFSRLQVRDSIEISHRRDYKPPADHTVKHNQKKKTDDDSGQFSAPIKHFRGDSCPIADPIKRDKEIRALLGVDKGVHTSTSPGRIVEEKNFAVPVHYFWDGKTCEKKIVTGINMMEMPEPPCVCCDIQKYCGESSNSYCGYGPPPPQHQQLSHHDRHRSSQQQHYEPHQPKSKSILSTSPKAPSQHNKKVNADANEIVKETAEQEQTSSDSDSPEENPKEESPSPMVESPSPEEESPSPEEESPSPVEETPSPVVQKVPTKRLSISTKSAKKKSKANSTGTQYETQVQRTSLYQQLILNRNIQVFLQVEQFSKQKPIILSRKQYDKVKRTIESTIANKTGREYKRKKCICKTSLVSVGDVRRKTNRSHTLHYDKPIQTSKKSLAQNANKNSTVSNKSKVSRSAKKNSKHLVLFAKEEKNCFLEKKATVMPRQAMSSMEIQYASMSYMKRVTFSSTNVEAGSICPLPLENKESHSIHTIFKGHRRCPTPNLGTSMCSLYSEDNNAMFSPKPLIMVQESKQKKPFLRRLMSCLVMRSARASELNNIISPPVKVPTIDSSIDSYHISTSLGAIEVTSSIYDTSESFYSNHSVYPVNSKMKRGFFNSVREFLAIRKS